MTAINSFKDLRGWQLAVDLAVQIYHGTEKFPFREQFATALVRACDELGRVLRGLFDAVGGTRAST